MGVGSSDEREIRAARNQAMFRAVNEKINGLDDLVAEVGGRFVVVCECANEHCIETLEITPAAYAAIRGNPRQFPVLRGHVYPEVERVVEEAEGYVVVEKFGRAGEVAEAIEARSGVTPPSRG
jgi:5-bromo-4-chloroindolyl phosphate hydrolysis protein